MTPEKVAAPCRPLLMPVLCWLQTEEKKVRKKLEGGKYTMLETRKDGTKFTNKALREVADRLQGLSKQYESRQHQLVDEVSHPPWDSPFTNQGTHRPQACSSF